MKNKAVAFLVMHVAFLLYALYAVIGKIGAQTDFLSPRFILLYGIVFILLFVSEVLWQQVLKVIPLTIATANKTITIVWGIVFGFVFFKEAISLKMIIGAIVILAGILLLCTAPTEPDTGVEAEDE